METVNVEEASCEQTFDDGGEEASSSGGGGRRPTKAKGTGKKKIEMKKIQNKSSLKVTFSKRRKGMFKKADEICQSCDAQIAIIVYSTKGRLFPYGCPSVEHVVNRFLGEDSDESEAVSTEELPLVAEEEVEEEEEEKEEENEEDEEGEGEYWFEGSMNDLDTEEELEEYIWYLEALRKNLLMKVEELVARRSREIDFLGLHRN